MSAPYYAGSGVTVFHGDCIEVMRGLPDSSVHAVVTDPPYGLEFMGRGWDAPWRESDINADAGMSETGYTDGGKRLPRPSFTGSTNPKCARCKGTRRGRRDGTAKVPVCLCEDGGRFPNVRAVEMRAFEEWVEEWAAECLRVLKPGGHMLAFGGSRTWHRLAAGIEEAGFEIRDSIAWLYGSGFPKSLDVAKAIDKQSGYVGELIGTETVDVGMQGGHMHTGRDRVMAEREVRTASFEAEPWQGWGTALKPAFEPIVVARKPFAGTVATNVLAHGTGALNIDASRIGHEVMPAVTRGVSRIGTFEGADGNVTAERAGRWPANVVLDESQADALDEQTGMLTSGKLGPDNADNGKKHGVTYGTFSGRQITREFYGDTGGASKFFPTFRYEAKAPTSERPKAGDIAHPTVKPLDLMRWLVRLVTPPDGTVLEPFAGSGTTLEAAVLEGFNVIGIEREADYLPLIKQRLAKPMQQSLFGNWDGAA